MALTLAAPVRRALPLPELLDRIGYGATLLLPLFLLHGRSLAEAALATTAVSFLVRSALLAEWGWLRRGWVRIGLAWWAWLVLCSLPVPALGLGLGGWPSFLQGLAMGRFIVFAAALESGVLDDPKRRVWLWRAVAACLAYIAVQELLQLITGTNLWGNPRNGDGELTGPFNQPRAGPPFSRILLPVLLPPIGALLDRRKPAATVGAGVVLLGGVALMVLFGQRMPLALTLFGIAISAVLLKRLRVIGAIAIVGAAAIVFASSSFSPRTEQRLVEKTTQQVEAFAGTQYALIYRRSVHIAEQHPLTGRGFDGFRTGCPDPRYFRFGPDGKPIDGGDAICTTHPHNFYFQALTDAGLPGLALFTALAGAWLLAAWRGLWRRDPPALRVGLFAALAIQLWPLASTSSFAVVPMSGWFFLLLGWALAESRAAIGPGLS